MSIHRVPGDAALHFPANLFQRFLAPLPSLQWGGLHVAMTRLWPDDPRLIEQWQSLAADPQYTFFHQPRWQQTVWRHLRARGRLRLILVWRGEQGGRLVAALPLRLTSKTGYETPAPHITDYLDPLIASDVTPQVPRIILRLLRDRFPLTLHNLRADAPTLPCWHAAAAEEKWAIDQTIIEQCPRLTLPATVDQWMQRLDAHYRKELRRKIRKVMQKGAGRLERCPPEQAQAGINQLLTLMQHRGQKATDVRRTLGPILRQTAPQLIRDGRLHLSTLFIENRPAAAILESPSPSGPMLYNSGFDTTMKPWSPGLVAVALSITRAIEQGCSSYDFLRGEEPYKYELGAQNRPLLRLMLKPM